MLWDVAYVTQWFASWLKCTRMTLDISMLKYVFLLYTQNINTWHLPLVCSIIPSPYILKCKTLISKIPMCYANYHSVNIFFTLISYLCWWITSYWHLADVTLWDLYAPSLGLLQIMYVTLHTINGVVHFKHYSHLYYMQHEEVCKGSAKNYEDIFWSRSSISYFIHFSFKKINDTVVLLFWHLYKFHPSPMMISHMTSWIVNLGKDPLVHLSKTSWSRLLEVANDGWNSQSK